ncbi:ATP-binding protein [Halomarina pelagica]|uniref:ATP-binding protein n=1 Tax=Halomarina pelagica TaxID=2961599 RepID=UPI0020C3B980|nr:DUF87 domain-containing protein [Halomarina sp. BND7]
MSETETITVAEVSDGAGSAGDPGTTVEMPAVEVLTGRGFVTGKSGSGKSNTASVVIEKLLDRQFSLLIVDIDGEYYGLKEKYEILHVGADEECDIQVGAEHAEKIADLALRNNIPIILDVSSFLDEREAAALLTEVAKQLFAKEKKLKKPFLLIVEEVHEWIPEGGGLDECGRMLIKIGKRGRKHGLGITGISQRPADVKKDFITQCDWLVWHRLTWRNDTKVVKRVLGSEYSAAVEDLGDGEGFLVTDWSEQTRRVQFQRKRTFDAGATPGLDDFERPDLKSVSADLVGELESITEEQDRREDRIEELEQELLEKEERIRMLEQDLADARDLSRMADQFAAALFDHPGRSRMRIESEQSTLEEHPGVEYRNGRAAANGVSAGGDEGSRDGRSDASGGTSATDLAPWPEQSAGSGGGDGDGGGDGHRNGTGDVNGRSGGADDASGARVRDRSVVERLRERLESMDPTTRSMLARYRERGPLSPLDAHVAAGGSGDRTVAYSRNGELREVGFIEHAGRGEYVYVLPDLVAREFDHRLSPEQLDERVERIERYLVGGPWPAE